MTIIKNDNINIRKVFCARLQTIYGFKDPFEYIVVRPRLRHKAFSMLWNKGFIRKEYMDWVIYEYETNSLRRL